MAVASAGCGTGGYTSEGSQGAGKELFTQACGTCHVLADAGTAGSIGPNLDHAFAQARIDGLTSDTFAQVIAGQIRYPITETSTGAPGMPDVNETLPSCEDVEGNEFCVDDQDRAVSDVAAYVSSVAGTGVEPEAPADAKGIFTDSCGGCHTLADAGTSGTVGPNLDDAKPSFDLVVERVTNGSGAMPSFSDKLSEDEINNVAAYVVESTG